MTVKSTTNTVLFANQVLTFAEAYGVFYLEFASVIHSPNTDGKTVDFEPVINCRMRLDEMCARQLLGNLASMLKALEERRAAAVGHGLDAAVGTEVKKH